MIDFTNEDNYLYEFENLALSLNPDKKLEDEDIIKLNKTEIKNLAINTYSCFKNNNKKINYFQYISSMENEDCKNALKYVFPKIKLEKIVDYINNIEKISKIRKEFYIAIIRFRYELLEKAYKEILNQ